MSKIIIFGCGGGADTATRYLKKDSPHEIVAYTVDRAFKKESTYQGLPLADFETIQDKYPPSEYKMFMLLRFEDMNQFRIQKFNEAKAKGYSFINYVSSDIRVDLKIGENCFILDHQSINLDVRIGNNVVMWSGNHVGDRTVIGDHNWITSQVAIGGDVNLGEACFVGMHATIGHGISVGERNFIGAGALLTKSTKENAVYVVENTKLQPMTSDVFVKFVKN